jgi:hypothetical protein
VAPSQSDRMPTPVDEFRHHATAHQFLTEIADLPSLKQPLDPSRDFRCHSRVLPGWNANCSALQPARDIWDRYSIGCLMPMRRTRPMSSHDGPPGLRQGDGHAWLIATQTCSGPPPTTHRCATLFRVQARKDGKPHESAAIASGVALASGRAPEPQTGGGTTNRGATAALR